MYYKNNGNEAIRIFIMMVGVILSIFILAKITLGAELEMSYSDTNAPNGYSGMFRFKNQYTSNSVDYDVIVKDLYTSKGNSLYMKYNGEYEFDWRSVFIFMDYNNDEVLKIESASLGIGMGFVLIDQEYIRQKVSVAGIIRGSNLLGSFRGKVRFGKDGLFLKLMGQYITGVEEFFSESSIEYKLSENMITGFKIDYASKSGIDRYFQSIFLRCYF